EAATVAAELGAADPRMKKIAWWIASRHADWGGSLAGLLGERLGTQNLTAAEREELIAQLARFARATPVQEFLTQRLCDPAASRDARRLVLRAMARSGLKEAPEAWLAGLIQILAGDDGELTQEAVATARALRISKQRSEKLDTALLQIGRNDRMPLGVRLS